MAALALVDVKDIVEWLRHTEEQIGLLYARAAQACSMDPSFCAFLRRLSEDERSHAAFMSSAYDRLHGVQNRPHLEILLDGQTRSMVEGLLERFGRLLTRAEVSKKDVVEYIARAEASELNPVFLYVAAECQRADREGERMTHEIRGHLLRIQDFIDALPHDMRPSVDVRVLPLVGEERFLVVEDNAALRRLMASLLARRGAVDTASDGHEALKRLREHFHDAIVTDIQMPGMDGLEFYRGAVEYDPRLERRFLFCSGQMSSGNEKYLRDHDLPFLQKPFGVAEFQVAMDGVLAGDVRKQQESCG